MAEDPSSYGHSEQIPINYLKTSFFCQKEKKSVKMSQESLGRNKTSAAKIRWK